MSGEAQPETTTISPVQHTAGPWRVRRGEIFAVNGEYLGVVYRTEAWSSGRKVLHEDQANARLVAAAPDLLEALKFVMSAHGEQLHDAFEQAHNAIAKAEGSAI